MALSGDEVFGTVVPGFVTDTDGRLVVSNLAALEAQIDAAPRGVLASHTLTNDFLTAAPHTAAQDEGLTVEATYEANRVLRVTLKVIHFANGGVNNIAYEVFRGSTLLSRYRRLNDPAYNSETWEVVVNGPSVAGTETFKVQMYALTNNTQIQSYGSAEFPRQLIVEDIGAQ